MAPWPRAGPARFRGALINLPATLGEAREVGWEAQRTTTEHRSSGGGRSGEYEGRDVVPLWVADMCLSAPQPIVDAIVARAQHGVYGYTDCPAALTAAMLTHLEGYYGCRHPEATWFRWLPGLLPGLNHAVRASCTPGSGDAVAVATPIYPPFLDTAAICGAVLVRVPLAEVRLGESALRYR